MKPESNRPITIEDLLRLKRAERPPADFWATFDRELRAKQLAALVAKRPWWQRLPTAFSGLKRFRVPLGATAVVATAFFSVRDYQATPPAQQAQSPVETIAVETRSEVLPSRSEADRVSLQIESAPISSTAIPDVIKAGVSGSETPTTGEFSRVAQAA